MGTMGIAEVGEGEGERVSIGGSTVSVATGEEAGDVAAPGTEVPVGKIGVGVGIDAAPA